MLLTIFTYVLALVFTVSLYYRLKGYMMLEKFKRETGALDDVDEMLTGGMDLTRLGWVRVIFDLAIEMFSLGVVMCLFWAFSTITSYYSFVIGFMILSSYYGFKTYAKCKRESEGKPDDVTT